MTSLMALPGVRCDHDVILIAFGLIELQGDDLRDDPLEQRKQPLAMLARGGVAITYNEHLAHDGAAVFEHACRLAPYRSVKSKNPACGAVRREREEDWGWPEA